MREWWRKYEGIGRRGRRVKEGDGECGEERLCQGSLNKRFFCYKKFEIDATYAYDKRPKLPHFLAFGTHLCALKLPSARV